MAQPSLSGSGGSTSWTAATDPAEFSFTVGAGITDSCLVVVSLTLDNQDSSALTPTAKWGGSGGTAMTRQVLAEHTSTSRYYTVAIFTLLAPTAQTANVYVDYSQATIAGSLWAGVFQNVHQTTPVLTTATSANNINSTSATATLTASYTNPSITIAGWAIRDGNNTHTVTGATGTLLNQSTGTDTTIDMVGVVAYENLSASGSTSIDDGWGATEFGTWAMIELQGTVDAATGQPMVARARLVPGMRVPHGGAGW